MNWKEKVDKKFESLADFIFNNKIKIVLFSMVVVALFASQLRNITIDTSTEGFLYKDDPMILEYNAFRNQFGRDEKILVAIQTDNVFSKKNIEKIEKLHKELENNLPYIDSVDSLINARDTKGTKDSLIVDDLYENMPKNDAEAIAKKKQTLSNKLLVDLLVNKKSTITNIIITTNPYTSLDENGNDIVVDDSDDEFEEDNAKQNEPKKFLTDYENTAIFNKTQEIVKKYQSDDFKILVSGSAAMSASIKNSMTHDMQKFLKLTLLVIVIFLSLMFRRVSGVVIPMFVTALSIITAISLMAITGNPLTMVTQIMPSFLLSVTIGANVHLLSMFFKRFDEVKDKQDALRYALGHSGFAILMTSLTTAAGLWMFSFSDIAPIANLGIFASAGIVLSLFFILVVTPAILSIIRLKPKKVKREENSENVKDNLMDKALKSMAETSIKHPKAIIFISFGLIFTALFLSSKLQFSHNPMKWLAEDNDVRVSTEILDKNMKGSLTLEVIVDTKQNNGLYEPKILNAINDFSKDVLSIKTEQYYVGKAVSVVDIIKETNKALHANDDNYYSIPSDKNLIAQEMLLFENSGSDDLEDFVDSRFSKARITLKLPNIDAIFYEKLLLDIDQRIEKHFAGLVNENNQKLDISTTGISKLLAVIMSKSIYSSAISYAMAILAISLMMILLVGNIKIGLITMIPNVSPILVATSIMYIFDMPLDMFTMLIGSIAIGLAVDDTVHFIHSFRRYELKYNDTNKAIRMTMLTSGRAMVITTIVLIAGFFVFMGASMSNLFNFGLLTGIAIFTALIADFFLVPALIKVTVKKKEDLLN